MSDNSAWDAEPIGIAGTGRVAQALGRLLRESGQPVVSVGGRSAAHARAAAEFVGNSVTPLPFSELSRHASRLIVAVPDSVITEVAAAIASTGSGEGVALHTSGTVGPEALNPLKLRGFACATFHPLQTIADPAEGVAALRGIAFATCGDEPAMAWAEQIAHLVNGFVIHVRAERLPLYHAAAVMASNYLVGLTSAAQTLMERAGVEKEMSLRALAPLARTALDNALAHGPVDALTGPIERGDIETVRRHLKALESVPEQILRLYCAAGLEVLEIARVRGLSSEAAQSIEQELRGS